MPDSSSVCTFHTKQWDGAQLEKAGIDMSIFMPHSTRAASTSKAV